MASGLYGAAVVHGNNIALCINCSSDEESNYFLTALQREEKLWNPLYQSFWATFWHPIDKYGITDF